jgi:hypothetical protein
MLTQKALSYCLSVDLPKMVPFVSCRHFCDKSLFKEFFKP